MNLRQFKWVDLLIFSLVAVVFEVINRFASVSFSSFKLIFLSFTIPLTLISMYRWGYSGIVVCLFATLISVIISTHNKEIEYYVAYVFGTFLALTIGFLIFQVGLKRKRIKKNLLLIIYLVFDFALVILFRSLFSALFHLNEFNNIFILNLETLLIQESMSIFISIILILIANRKNGQIIVEMGKYVREVQELNKLGGLKEIKESPNFNADNPFTEYNQIDESNILEGGVMSEKQLKELSKMFEKCNNINIDDPLDCLAEKEKKEKDD